MFHNLWVSKNQNSVYDAYNAQSLILTSKNFHKDFTVTPDFETLNKSKVYAQLSHWLPPTTD